MFEHLQLRLETVRERQVGMDTEQVVALDSMETSEQNSQQSSNQVIQENDNGLNSNIQADIELRMTEGEQQADNPDFSCTPSRPLHAVPQSLDMLSHSMHSPPSIPNHPAETSIHHASAESTIMSNSLVSEPRHQFEATQSASTTLSVGNDSVATPSSSSSQSFALCTHQQSSLSTTPTTLPMSSVVTPFNCPVGPTVFPPESSAAVYFEYFMTPRIIDHIVTQTNLFASQRSTPLLGWETCTSDRLRSLLGLVIAMGVKRLPNLEDYWSQNSILGTPELVVTWPYRQFRALLSNLHFNDNRTAVPRGEAGYDRLHKIRPLLDMVARRCLAMYHPERELSVDEAMVGFKGRSALKQYIPLKPTKNLVSL